MGLTMRERHAVIREIAQRFRNASRVERGRLLDEVVKLTGYNRSYAGFVLRHCGTRHVRMINGERIIFTPAHARSRGAPRQRKGIYNDEHFMNALTRLWALSDGLCGKRLVIFIRTTLPILERQRSFSVVEPKVREQLLSISAATIDRLLAKTKTLVQLKGRSYTRPGTLLKHHIPIRTFADWNEQSPGFCELDLVAHDGGSPYGEFIQTLTLTDVATGWTETRAVKNKAQCHVFEALKRLRSELPFPLLGIDSDNGGEFINNELRRYCESEKITFTRSRPYRKNDNCFVEQKNYSIVRRSVGYYRYDQLSQLALLEQLYFRLRLFTNFFLPVMRLKDKIRTGSKLTRHYDPPLTPYQRLLDHPKLSIERKEELPVIFQPLNIVSIKRELDELQQRLFRSAIDAGDPRRAQGSASPSESHAWRHTHYGQERKIADALKKKELDSNQQNHKTPKNHE